jgi:hypothetical protein
MMARARKHGARGARTPSLVLQAGTYVEDWSVPPGLLRCEFALRVALGGACVFTKTVSVEYELSTKVVKQGVVP